MKFRRVIGNIDDVQVIASGRSIRELRGLIRVFGPGRWRKMKGKAKIETLHGEIRLAEIHWYEAHGIGQRKMKIKGFLD